jgi:hypothetical protein
MNMGMTEKSKQLHRDFEKFREQHPELDTLEIAIRAVTDPNSRHYMASIDDINAMEAEMLQEMEEHIDAVEARKAGDPPLTL